MFWSGYGRWGVPAACCGYGRWNLPATLGCCLVEFPFEIADCGSPFRGVFFQDSRKRGAQLTRNGGKIWLGRQMLHQNLGGGFTVERKLPCDHLVEHHAQRIHIDFGAVLAPSHFRSHVVDGSNTLRMLTPMITVESFGETDISHFDNTALTINIGGLEIPMHDSPVMQVSHARDQSAQPFPNFAQR